MNREDAETLRRFALRLGGLAVKLGGIMQPKIIKLKFEIEILCEDIEREGAEVILIKALASAIPRLKEEIEILKLEEEV